MLTCDKRPSSVIRTLLLAIACHAGAFASDQTTRATDGAALPALPPMSLTDFGPRQQSGAVVQQATPQPVFECPAWWNNGTYDGVNALNSQEVYNNGNLIYSAVVADDFFLNFGKCYVIEAIEVEVAAFGIPLNGNQNAPTVNLRLFEDCNGKPAGPAAGFQEFTLSQSTDLGPVAGWPGFNRYRLRWEINLFEYGYRRLWIAPVGQGQGLYYWLTANSGTIQGAQGQYKAPQNGFPNWIDTDDITQDCPTNDCWDHCTDFAFRVCGKCCWLLKDQSQYDLAGLSSIAFANNVIFGTRAVDNFQVPPGEQLEICRIEAWMATNCGEAFMEIYENFCDSPVDGQTFSPIVLDKPDREALPGVTYDGLQVYRYSFTCPGVFLAGDRNYWLSLAALGVGSPHERAIWLFRQKGACHICITEGQWRSFFLGFPEFTPVSNPALAGEPRDFAFRIYAAEHDAVATEFLEISATDENGEPLLLDDGQQVEVYVDGVRVGVLGAGGTFQIQLPAGPHHIQLVVPFVLGGSQQVVIEPGQPLHITLQLNSEGMVDGTASLVLDDVAVVGGEACILPEAATSFSARIVDTSQQTIPVDQVFTVEARNPADAILSLTQFFVVTSDGVVTVPNMAAFRAALNGSGFSTFRFIVSAADSRGFSFEVEKTFYLAANDLQAQLIAPPSQPGLPVANLPVIIRVLGTPIAYQRTTDATGRFGVQGIPRGQLSFEVSTDFLGQTYSSFATLALFNSDGNVQIRLLGIDDILNGVSAIVVLSNLAELTGPTPQREAVSTPPADPFAILGPEPSISTTSGAQDAPQTRSVSVPVSQGTKSVKLRYTTQTAEYPTYVLQQSVFNDRWSVILLGPSGQSLKNITRNVNAQISQEPVWVPGGLGGTTGMQEEQIDVTSLAAEGPVQLVLLVSATNVGDSIVPTSVTASVAVSNFSISVAPDVLGAATRNDGSYYSTPRSGDTNVLHRTFTIEHDLPPTATVTRVKVELQTASGATLGTVLDDAPGSTGVQTIGPTRLRARVTFGPDSSTLNSDPPPTEFIRFRFMVEAMDQGGSLMAEERSAVLRALWRMPTGFARFGTRDPGLDDWCRSKCYQWLSTNAALINRINDISGEHGRDIGHTTHAKGMDIDAYLCIALSLASSSDNYAVLQSRVRNAVRDRFLNASANTTNTQTAADFVSQSRTHLALLLQNATVAQLRYAEGSPVGSVLDVPQSSAEVNVVLPSGWARTLLRTGQVSATVRVGSGAPQQFTFDTGAGNWSPTNLSRLVHDYIHNDHLHIDLID